MDDDGERRDAEPCHYGAYYFEHCCGLPYGRDPHWMAFFGGIAERIVRDIAPRTVLDAGCAMGILVESLRDRDVAAFGIDISEYAISRAHERIRPFCRVHSITDPLPDERFDLLVTIEVLEHLPPEQAEAAIANFCALADDIVFSSTPFDYKEASHFNVQPPEYWAELFARHGFFRDVDFDASFITRWATRFRKARDPIPRVVAAYERRFWKLWQDNLGARESLVEHQNLLIEADRRVAEGVARIGAMENQAALSAAALAETDSAISALRTELAASRDQTRIAASTVHERDRSLERARADLDDREATIAALEGRLAVAEDLALQAANDLRALREQHLETIWRIGDREQADQEDRRVLRAELDARERVSQHLWDRLESAETQLRSIRASSAWRLASWLSRARGSIRAVAGWRSDPAERATPSSRPQNVHQS